MNKIKVIDLLNMISKGEEVPKKIQVYSDIFVLDYDNKIYKHQETGTNLLSIYNGNILNYEVAIIGEDKKIEKLHGFNLCKNSIDDEDLELHYTGVSNTFNDVYFKINEIIKVINEMREDK